jgi:hypothetical protein
MSLLNYVIYGIRDKVVEMLMVLSEWDDESSESNYQNVSSSHDSAPDNHLRFGTSPEIQQCESVLQRERSLVDFHHRTVNSEQAECDSIESAINASVDKDRISALELDLQSHQRKLSQARADYATHQKAEYDAQDRLNELRASAHKD